MNEAKAVADPEVQSGKEAAARTARRRQEEAAVLAGIGRLEFRQRVQGKDGSFYRVIEPLGIGGNSSVYLVESLGGHTKGVLFALKMFIQVNDTTRRERFEKEVEFLQGCDHPAVMRAYDSGVHRVGEEHKFPFVITEYLNETLRTAMLRGLTTVEKTVFSLQLLAGLAYLSSREPAIIHRDIKPENIFVKGRSAVFGDFGLLKEGDGIDPSIEHHILGSTGVRFPRLYPTPDLIEYCKKRKDPSPLTAKSDVFQLGLVLAELFTGHLPIKPRTEPFEAIELEELRPIEGNQGEAIKGHILKMLQMDPDLRPRAADVHDSWEGSFLWMVEATRSLGDKLFGR
ncbi:protein kinase domain-containing protein [Sinimarinibacterium flocculans]|uniref:protein kinase domain-containing protein n=1 Tax=Sinimarinibacterium flocculans TaxID=985250 RepID=UPI003513A8EA